MRAMDGSGQAQLVAEAFYDNSYDAEVMETETGLELLDSLQNKTKLDQKKKKKDTRPPLFVLPSFESTCPYKSETPEVSI
jgi:hypothetical protein